MARCTSSRRNALTGDRNNSADVAVIGLGAMGAATLYQLALRGVRAIGFDRFAPPHTMGSSHGETRITRQAIGEGEAYVPLVLRAHAIWDALEASTGVPLITRCGFLAIAAADARAVMHGKPDFVQATIDAARRHRIDHEVLDAAEAARRFPQFALRGDETCYFEPGGGYLFPEACVAVQLAEARRLGARLQLDTRVHAVEADGAGVRIEAACGTYFAARAVVAAGAWVGDFVPPSLRRHFAVHRQVLHWLPVSEPARFADGASPVFIWSHGPGSDDLVYGFPPLPGAAMMKCAAEYYDSTVGPDSAMAPDSAMVPDSDWRHIGAGEAAAFFDRHIAGRVRGVGAAPVRSQACLYTVTPDGDFVIDSTGADDRITLVSACSGHGFKHSAAIGEAVAQGLCGMPSLLPAALFAVDRLTAGAR